MKNDFSSSIDESLAGRTSLLPEPKSITPTVTLKTDQKGNQDKGLGRNLDGSFKQSKAGRRKIPKELKKVQFPLTITPKTNETLEAWASTKPRTAANYVSEYVEEHLEEIMNYFMK